MARKTNRVPHARKPRPRLALVVDASPEDRRALAALARRMGLEVVEAADAESALAALAGPLPHLVLLDVETRDDGGQPLLSRIRAERPFVPIVAVSAREDPDVVEEALNLGAVHVLAKPIRRRQVPDLRAWVAHVLEEEGGIADALGTMLERRTRLRMPGDPALVARVVALLAEEARGHYAGRAVPLSSIKLALFEALANAVEHGSLEIGYEEKSEALRADAGLGALVAARLRESPYAGRRIEVTARYEPDRIEYAVRDEGRGFDPSRYDPKSALADVNRLHGRGLALIRHVVDEVAWNEAGNEIRMTVRLDRSEERGL